MGVAVLYLKGGLALSKERVEKKERRKGIQDYCTTVPYVHTGCNQQSQEMGFGLVHREKERKREDCIFSSFLFLYCVQVR